MDWLAGWRRLEALAAGRLYRFGLLCATRPVLVLYACMVVIIALSYPAAVYLDRAINGPAGHEPLRYWQPAYQLTGVPATATGRGGWPEAAGDGAEPLPQRLLQVRQVLANLADVLPLENQTLSPGGLGTRWRPRRPEEPPPLEAYPHGVLERHLLLRLARLQRTVESFAASDGTTLDALCFRPPAAAGGDGAADAAGCLVNSPLGVWNHSETALGADANVRATLSQWGLAAAGWPLSLRSVFGGIVTDDATGRLTYASSMVVTYFTTARVRAERDRADSYWAELWRSDDVVGLSHLLAVSDQPDVDGEGYRQFVFRPRPATARVQSAEVWLLGVAYLVMFLYISLSLGRVELVKSKFGLGLSAVATVFFALLMSVGICNLLGTPLTLLPWEILPFLLMFIGVENTFTITNAVTSTSIDLPVKERVAIGLATAAPAMIRSLTAELVLMLAGTVTSIMALRQFCVFALVAVVVDFGLQITFFVTVLSIDIRRLELVDLQDTRVLSMLGHTPARPDSTPGTPVAAAEPAVDGASPLGRRRAVRPSVLTAVLVRQGRDDGVTVDDTALVASDEFWSLVNPDNAELMVEVLPPVHVELWPRWRIAAAERPGANNQTGEAPSAPQGADEASYAGGDSEAMSGAERPQLERSPEDEWQMLVDRMRMEWLEWGSRSSSYWVVVTRWLMRSSPALMDYLFRAGPLVVIFVTATLTAVVVATTILFFVIWPTWRTSFQRRHAAAVAPEWTQGPVREVHLVGSEDDIECFDGSEHGGVHVVTAGLDRAVRVWEVATGECVHTFSRLPSAVWQLRVVGDLVVAGCASGHVVVLSTAADRRLRWTLPLPPPAATSASAATSPRSPASPTPAAASVAASVAVAHVGGVTCMAVDPASMQLFTGGNDRTVKGWSLLTGELLFTLGEHQSPLATLGFHDGLGLLFSGTADGTVRVFKAPVAGPAPGGSSADGSAGSAAAPLCRWTLHGHVNAITSVVVAEAASPSPADRKDDTAATDLDDETEPARGSDRPVGGSGTRRRHPGPAAGGAVASAPGAPSPARLRLVTASQDGQIRVWDIGERATGACVATLAYHRKAVTALAYDPHCDVLASAGQDERVALWDLTAYRLVYRKHTPNGTSLALRDSVLVVGQMSYGGAGGSSRAMAAAAASVPAGATPAEHPVAQRWADSGVDLMLLDVRTRTVLRRSLALQRIGRAADDVVHRLAFSGDTLLVGAGDTLTLVRLSRSRAVKRA